MDLTRTISSALREEEAAHLRELLAELGGLAREHRFRVAPNPSVGAAVLSAGVEIGRGFHELWGGPHAELLALEAARATGMAAERWDTLLVTLEPCSTAGKTPPCTDAIRAAGIRRVVVGAVDPDARHRGRGLEALHAAGIEVIHLRGAAPLAEATPHFLHWTSHERLRRPRPWTIAKWAQTRTGQLTPPADTGAGRWISGPLAMAEVQVLRGRVDAILTGVGTVLADDPRLTVRPPGAIDRAPLRAVLDSELRTPPDGRLLAEPGEGEAGGPVHVFCRVGPNAVRRRALERAGATIHPVRVGDDGRPSLREVVSSLWELEVRRLLVEAGPELLSAVLRAELVDQIKVYTGDVNGGRGPSLGEFLAPERLDGVQHREVGQSSLLDAFLRR